MKNIIVFVILFACVTYGFTQDEVINTNVSSTTTEMSFLPPFDLNVHKKGYTVVLLDGNVYKSTGSSWLQIVEVASNDSAPTPFNVPFNDINGNVGLENSTTANIVLNMTGADGFQDGDIRYARATNTGILTLGYETGSTYTIDGETVNYIVRPNEACAFIYSATNDDWKLIWKTDYETNSVQFFERKAPFFWNSKQVYTRLYRYGSISNTTASPTTTIIATLGAVDRLVTSDISLIDSNGRDRTGNGTVFKGTGTSSASILEVYKTSSDQITLEMAGNESATEIFVNIFYTKD